jgi:hypothetical protein
MQPALQPDVSLLTVLLLAALNPAVIAVGYLLGRRADQAGKLLVAGFAASLAGFALLWLGAALRLGWLSDASRAAAGIFVAQILFGAIWAWIGFKRRGR